MREECRLTLTLDVFKYSIVLKYPNVILLD